MLKHMPKSSLAIILQLFNKIWIYANFPKDWLHSTVVPIFKPGKPINFSSSYRPISLISSLCKIMEKIVIQRLNWYLEPNDLISEFQSGFRSLRRTTDHILRVHDIAYKTVASRPSEMALVFRGAVLLKLIKLRSNGPILYFIKSLLYN